MTRPRTPVDPNDQAAIDIIASSFGHMAHPDGQAVKIAGYSTIGKPKAHRDAASSAATRAAQAIVHTLRAAGKSIVDTAPYRGVQPPATPIDDSQPRLIEVWCGLCAATRPHPMFTLTLRNPATNNKINLNGPQILQMIHTLPTDCPHMTAPPVDNVAEVAKAHEAGYRT